MRLQYKQYQKYTEKEKEYLKTLYSHATKEILLQKIPNHTWDALRQEAKKLGLIRELDYRKNKKTTKLDKLTNGTVISYYWLGFLLADGNFRSNKAIRCELSLKDINHLDKLAKYLNAKININNKRKSCTLSVYDCDIVPIIINILGLDPCKKKTYNCPNIKKLKKISSPNFFSLLIGFIDGDGCIIKRTSTYLIVSNHKSWEPFYKLMLNYLSKYSDKNLPRYTITKRGYLRWSCGQKDLLNNLKKEVEIFNLPILERKWQIIKENNAQS
jgi:hypothetical protein